MNNQIKEKVREIIEDHTHLTDSEDEGLHDKKGLADQIHALYEEEISQVRQQAIKETIGKTKDKLMYFILTDNISYKCIIGEERARIPSSDYTKGYNQATKDIINSLTQSESKEK